MKITSETPLKWSAMQLRDIVYNTAKWMIVNSPELFPFNRELMATVVSIDTATTCTIKLLDDVNTRSNIRIPHHIHSITNGILVNDIIYVKAINGDFSMLQVDSVLR